MADLTTLLSKFLTSLYAGAINSATDPLLMQVGGVTKLTVSGTAVTSTVPVLAPDGTDANAALGFTSAVGTGLTFANPGFYATVAGAKATYTAATAFRLRSDGALEWSSSANPGSAPDVSLSRGAANRLDLATGDSFNIVSGALLMAATQVVGAQGAAVADASGGATVDTEARAALNALLARLRTHGLIAT